jgi:hypothetical protein
MEDRTLKQLLMSSSYFVLNKQIVKAIGIESAFLLTTLIEASDGLANDDGWFYKTAPSLEEETGLSNHKQSKIIEELTKLGILEQENKGMPMKRYFRINFNKIEELVFKIQDLKNSKPSIEENKKQGFKNFECKDLKNSNACIEKISNNKEYINNNLENNNLLKEKNIKKEKSKNEVETYINNLDLDDNYKQLLFKYVEYRKSIKKQIKTIVPIQKIIRDFPDYFSLDEAIEIAQEKEWQGLEPEWIAKYKLSKTNNTNNKLAQSKDTSEFLVDDNYIDQMKERYGL